MRPKLKKFIPGRGDIVLLSFSPQAGHEQAGDRPALVLSPKIFNEISGFAFCCPITRRRRDHPFEVLLPSGMKTTGAVLVEQLRSLAWRERKAQFIEKLPDEITSEVVGKITAILEVFD